MRPTSHLSLLLFLKLAATAPLQIVLPTDCKHYYTCQSHLQHDPRPATPPTRLSDPHFPSHQLAGTRPSSSDTTPDEDPLNNALITPLSRTSPSAALSATQPLTTAYLLSLTNSPLQEQKQDERKETKLPLPAKPTSSLSHLRKLDSIRYLASLSPISAPGNTVETTVTPISSAQCAPIAPSAYERIGQYQSLALDNSDLLIVGIVVLFLAIVVVVELVQKILEWRARTFGQWWRNGKGEIYLSDDDDENEWIPETPFFLLPPPPPRNKFAPAVYNDQYLKREVGIVNSEVGSDEKCELPAEDVRR